MLDYGAPIPCGREFGDSMVAPSTSGEPDFADFACLDAYGTLTVTGEARMTSYRADGNVLEVGPDGLPMPGSAAENYPKGGDW